MQKTVTVLVERSYKHPLYGKILKRTSKIHARNEINAKIGQNVRIIESRPIAKTVSYKVFEIISDKKEVKDKK
jgi:small subunit ribosomal protein S17